MPQKSSPKSVIEHYKKRQQATGPKIFVTLAIVFIVAGLGLVLFWLFSSGGPKITLFATKTPTPTVTYTPTSTPEPTSTPTITLTPTLTSTPTPSAPFIYVIQEGDYLSSLVEKFGLGEDGLELLFLLNPTIDPANPIIRVGDEITIPNPGMQLPTATPIPADLRSGTKITYIIQTGDTMDLIASKFNSTVEAILALKENKDAGITDANNIFAGQKIVVPVNIVTPTPTLPATVTPNPETPSVTPTP
jgi:LysM repeat protein